MPFPAIGRQAPAILLGPEVGEIAGEQLGEIGVQVTSVALLQTVHASDNLRPF